MTKHRRGLLAIVAILCLAINASTSSALDDLHVSSPRPPAESERRIAYGPDARQFGQLWSPQQAGKRPVVVLIHGGCWQNAYGLDLMEPLARNLRTRGFAVWNIEYRRLGDVGGGYPGTFQDVARATDFLRVLARAYPLNLHRVVLVGHSSGGQLALWDAGRRRLPKDSSLTQADPQPIAAVVSLAGIADLEAYRRAGPACGGATAIDALLAGSHRSGAAVFADTSPAALLPLKVPQIVVSGDVDPIVPEVFGREYAAKARAAGDKVRILELRGAGHFELIDPAFRGWEQVVRVLGDLAK